MGRVEDTMILASMILGAVLLFADLGGKRRDAESQLVSEGPSINQQIAGVVVLMAAWVVGQI